MLQSNVGTAFLLSLLAGLSTGIGGVLVVLQTNLNYTKLGYWQGAAGGFMLCVSFVDLLPEVFREEVAVWKAALLFALGVGVVLCLKFLVPEPDLSTLSSILPAEVVESCAPSPRHHRHNGDEGGDDGGGGGDDDDDDDDGVEMNGLGGGAHSPRGEEFVRGGGGDAPPAPDRRHKVLWSGLVTAIGIGIHNFPEGIAVFISTLHGVSLGVPLAIAIGLHNIPEGMAVAMPIYFVTRSRVRAALVALVSGLAEPLGVLLVIMVSPSMFSGPLVALMLSAVAGIMVALSVVELIPQAAQYSGVRAAALSVAGGCGAMTAVLIGIQLVGLKV